MESSFKKIKSYIYQKLIIISSCAFFLVVAALNAQAIELRDMGVVALMVNSETETNRSRSMRQGLSLVLQRLTGDLEITNTEGGQQIIDQANRYLIQFSYDTVPSIAGIDYSERFYPNHDSYFLAYEIEGSQQKILKLVFDQQLLIEKLQEAQLPIWGQNRPEILFWWISQDNDQRVLFAESDRNIQHMSLHYFAEKRALAIKLPLMDLTDRALVNGSDLWGGYVDKIPKANKRYLANTWVQGKSYPSRGKWHAEWEVNVLGGVHNLNSSAATEFLLQKQVANTLADILAQEYAVASQGDNNELLIGVKQVGSIEKLLAIKQYLEGLFVVSHVEIKQISGEDLYLRLVLKEDVEKFAKLLAAGNKLVKSNLNVTPTIKNSKQPQPADRMTTNILKNSKHLEAQAQTAESLGSTVNYYRWFNN